MTDSLQDKSASTSRLIRLCVGYFIFYVVTGITVKYFLGTGDGMPGLKGFEFLVYSTAGGMGICCVVVLAARWFKIDSVRRIQLGPVSFPSEFLYIIPSGVCTAVVIPTTTLMYSLPISVLVAMVIMRGGVIVISRVVDAIQIRQGILTKKVYMVENIAVGFALSAVALKLSSAGEGGFAFLEDPVAMTTLGSYLTAYSFRIYIMNYYKNTAGKGVKRDNRAFFGVEQMSAAVTLVVVGVLVFKAPDWFGVNPVQIQDFRGAILSPAAVWPWALLAGSAFGVVAFFSVFIFMFKGRTATFAGLVNRLTSLIAGTTATLVVWLFFGGKFPKPQDWLSLVLIFVAVGFLSAAEKKRAAELAAQVS